MNAFLGTAWSFLSFLSSLSIAWSTVPSAAAGQPLLVAKGSQALSTLAEASGWKKTGRHDEVIRLCRAFEKKYPGRANCEKFGVTPEGREMVAIVASESGALKPEAARKRGLPVVMAQGAIHAGESDGKDAGFYVLRELLEHRLAQGALKKAVFVFVPVFNVDGHERFGPHNRPNQIGPEEMGWRVTARNLNLNRDYVKADSPEMQAMLRYLASWDPILYVDLHVTDGADFQHDVSTIVMPRLAGPEALRMDGKALSDSLMARLRVRGHLPLPFYPTFEREDDPQSGFHAGVSSPRYSEAYWSIRNRLGVLVETHSWKDYATRVKATIDALECLIDAAAREGSKWLASARAADLADAKGERKDVVLKYRNTSKSRVIDFLGYEYKREQSDVSGGMMVSYDPSKPKVLQLPLFDEVEPLLMVKAPRKGYYVSASASVWVEEKLRLHGVRYQRLSRPETIEAEVFRSTQPEFGKTSYEGRQSLTVRGEWKPERREILAGALFVPIGQPRALVAMHLLEPQAPDSLATWGFFNAYFERREYMEPYVAEQVARQMMEKDPAVKKEFEQRLRDDKEFAKDPSGRLDFFYQKHPSWDERFGLYPVFRI